MKEILIVNQVHMARTNTNEALKFMLENEIPNIFRSASFTIGLKIYIQSKPKDVTGGLEGSYGEHSDSTNNL